MANSTFCRSGGNKRSGSIASWHLCFGHAVGALFWIGGQIHGGGPVSLIRMVAV